MTRKENEKNMPRYKRQLRYLCRQASNGWKLRDRIDKGNQWALENRKTFFALVVGTLSFAFITTAISIIYDMTRDKSSDNIEMKMSKQENSIEDISPMMNGLRQIEETKKTTKLTPVRDKFIIQIVLTALIFLHIPAAPLAYSHKSNMP